MAKIWKIAPGQRADNWEICRDHGCIVLGWEAIGDFRKYDSKEDIYKALQKAYPGEKGCGSGAAGSIWRFVHVIERSDVIVANDGESNVVGIGVVESGYLHPTHPKNPVPVPGKDEWWRRQARLVDWRIKKRIDVHEKNFFVANTITALTSEQCRQIKQTYLKKDPELKETLDELFDGVSANEVADFSGESDIEGLKSEFLATKTKRSRRLRNKAFRAAEGTCAVCQRDFTRLLGGRGTRVLQVHHRKQLSARVSPAVTNLTDLVVVCANCHLLLHLDTRKTTSVDQLRGMLKDEGYLISK